jgi:cobalamin biosynthesis Mg chelatase CobN
MMTTRRRGGHGAALSTFLLSSLLALLALACFPIFAQADSSGVQYETALPNAEGKGPSQNEQIAESSESPSHSGGATAPTGGGYASGGSGSNSSMEGSSASGGSNGGHAAAGGGTTQGSQDSGKARKHAAAGQKQPVAHNAAPVEGGDNGSSPVIPILIAVLVLAAISVGAYLLRQKRQRDAGGASLSTKAG